MRKKVLLLAIITILPLTSCFTRGDIDIKENDQSNGELEDIDYDTAVDAGIFVDSNELRERLLTATSVELKSRDNQSLGSLLEGGKREELVRLLYTCEIKNELNSNQQGRVIGPINFYFSDRVDIYGLVNTEYIYIEGYYFLFNSTILGQLQDLFDIPRETFRDKIARVDRLTIYHI